MEDNKNVEALGEGPWIITLTDEETHEDQDFAVLADAKIGEKNYFALAPVDDESGDVIVLEYRQDGEDLIFETIEDDDEYETVEDYFNDLLFGEVDYDDGDNN